MFTHSQRLERWLGGEEVERISRSMLGWYGPPIPVGNVPGTVFAARGGDFVGPIEGGSFANLRDFAEAKAKRMWRDRRAIFMKWAARQGSSPNAGFASLSDLIAEATAGKRLQWTYYKQSVNTVGAVGRSRSLWAGAGTPEAGAAGSAAPGGRDPTDATTGAMCPFTNPTGGDTMHFVSAQVQATNRSTVLLYDRIFDVAKTMNSSSTEAVTGVPTRYQSTTPGAADSAEGNFLFPEVQTTLANTAHNWTVCQYTDQSNNTGATLPSLTGIALATAGAVDISTTGLWYAPLASGDTGIKALTQMQCSAAVATGAINFVMGHPIAFLPSPYPDVYYPVDGINSAFNLARIFDDACLALLDICCPATTTNNHNGTIVTVAG